MTALAAPGQDGHLVVTAAVLAAAVLHAAWNALAARLPDMLAGLGAIGLAQIALGALALVLVPAPAGPSRPFVIGSSALHVGYDLLLLNGYRVGIQAKDSPPGSRQTTPQEDPAKGALRI